jgi:hypothetical protein
MCDCHSLIWFVLPLTSKIQEHQPNKLLTGIVVCIPSTKEALLAAMEAKPPTGGQTVDESFFGVSWFVFEQSTH